jgi:hypothetical protein
VKVQRLLVTIAAVPFLSACSMFSIFRAHMADRHSTNIQTASGMTFPLTVADFRRAEITRYDADGTDIGVSYNLGAPTPTVAATVFVYPSPFSSLGSPPQLLADARNRLCDGELARRKTELIRANPGARLVREGPALPPGTSLHPPGRMAAYEVDEMYGGRRQTLSSLLYVYCHVGRNWALEYRFTSPKAAGADGAIWAFMTALRWTVPE